MGLCDMPLLGRRMGLSLRHSRCCTGAIRCACRGCCCGLPGCCWLLRLRLRPRQGPHPVGCCLRLGLARTAWAACTAGPHRYRNRLL